MRRSFFIVLLLAFAAPLCAGQNAGSGAPAFSIEPWNEDYSSLKDPAARTDPLDSIKYIPLDHDGNSYLTLGGQLRDRFDYFNNNGFGAAKSDSGFNLARLLANADLHLGPNFRAFVQVDTSLENNRAGGPRRGDVDDFDIQQAFFDIKFPLADSNSMVLRVGRQELIYGAQRLISPNDWRNVRLTFDGAKVSLYFPSDTLDVFVARPVVVDKTRLNSDDDQTVFAGIYNVTSLPQVIPGAQSKLDAYLLLLNRSKSDESPVDVQTYTLGARFHTSPGAWDFDVEPDWQLGQYSSSGIEAYSIAAEGGYTFRDAVFTPRASLGFDLSSGSPDPTGRFNQLFPPQYLYLGHMYLFGRQNLIDVHPELTIHITKDVTLAAAEHVFWRQNTNDAVYNLGGDVVRASGNSDASYIGNEFDIAANWQIQRHISMYVGYAHFFVGSFLNDTGPHEDEDVVYGAITLTF
jgi:Alginate export